MISACPVVGGGSVFHWCRWRMETEVTSRRPFRQGQVLGLVFVQRPRGSWQVGDNNCDDDEKRLRTHVVLLPMISTRAK